jgi:hypothetical protein
MRNKPNARAMKVQARINKGGFRHHHSIKDPTRREPIKVATTAATTAMIPRTRITSGKRQLGAERIRTNPKNTRIAIARYTRLTDRQEPRKTRNLAGLTRPKAPSRVIITPNITTRIAISSSSWSWLAFLQSQGSRAGIFVPVLTSEVSSLIL